MSQEQEYINDVLLPELSQRFVEWGREYQQERDLGLRGEFVGLYRKTRKLKTALWDSPEPPGGWREDLRTIALEVAAHALLMVHDMDQTGLVPTGETKPAKEVICGKECREGHTYVSGRCAHSGVDG